MGGGGKQRDHFKLFYNLLSNVPPPIKNDQSVCPKAGLALTTCFPLFSLVFDLLPSSSQRLNPGALQPILTDPTLHEIYLISTFKLQSKSSATIFGLYSSSDNSKYFEFTVMGRLNKGKPTFRIFVTCTSANLQDFCHMHLPVQDLGSAFFKMAPVTQFLFDVIDFLWNTYLM